MHESSLALFKPGSLRQKKAQFISQQPLSDGKRGCWKGPGPSSPWMIDLLPHHNDLGSDFSHASMWWVMMLLLSVIPS